MAADPRPPCPLPFGELQFRCFMCGGPMEVGPGAGPPHEPGPRSVMLELSVHDSCRDRSPHGALELGLVYATRVLEWEARQLVN